MLNKNLEEYFSSLKKEMAREIVYDEVVKNILDIKAQ